MTRRHHSSLRILCALCVSASGFCLIVPGAAAQGPAGASTRPAFAKPASARASAAPAKPAAKPATPASGAPAVAAQVAALPAIQLLRVESDEVRLPPEFQMALYENLLEEINKTGKFRRVIRDGDRTAAQEAGLWTLRSNVSGFKEGSARARQVTTVAGATSIQVHVLVTDAAGKELFKKNVEGKVRFFGENLRVTLNFSRTVAKLLKENL